MFLPLSVVLQWSGRLPLLRTPSIKITWRDTPSPTVPLDQEHTMTVTPTKEYVELIEDVVEALRLLLADACEDYRTQDTPPTETGEDSEFGSAT